MGQRDDILRIAKSYVGTCEGSQAHITILDTYNSHKPLARGYKVKTSDAWCMTFVSACFILGNAVNALGMTECGCQEYINYAKSKGMIVTTPTEGDLIFYDWGHDGVVDHVGIVEESGNTLTIIEGNKSDMVSRRIIAASNPSIKYFVRPKYGNTSGIYDTTKLSYAQKFDKTKAGTYKCIASDFVALRYNPFVTDTNKICEIKAGETCRNYGYFTDNWLLVTYGKYTGFANAMHLEKIRG